MRRKGMLCSVAVMLACLAVFSLQLFLSNEPKESKTVEPFRQRVIIRDSVDDPLPPEVKKAGAMEEKNEPQLLPNVNLDDPIVITKMPQIDANRP
ncbi:MULTISPECIES: hypothetical protein [Geobacillus]|uniref:hypothetical protein n=1 Tax=Geobacillus TaxID=129337 RepID=UPI000BB6908E|nr:MULTISPECIES: hypothetical protein [Geobacillus]MCK7605326.1 hypothetical protein [Geobacillus stearothermophilus]